MEKFSQKLKSENLKVMPQRIAIYKFLCETNTHPTTEKIYISLKNLYPTMSIATVYKTLTTLKKAHLIQELSLNDSRFRYDTNTDFHSHLICTCCKSIYARNGRCSGVSFVDSTALDVCDSHRIRQHKVFKEIAKRGKSSTGRFYGFKLHFVINDCGEILSFCLTVGNVDDRNLKVTEHLTKNIFGKLFADKGYIPQKLFEDLWDKGIQLITKQKKNTKKKWLMQFSDRLLLRKRAIIEFMNDFLKNICQI